MKLNLLTVLDSSEVLLLIGYREIDEVDGLRSKMPSICCINERFRFHFPGCAIRRTHPFS
jgi:hypothetical protein